jgi:uncharacterized protein YqjF (DUF2071 family)
MARRFLTAVWADLVMLNYEADPDRLRPLVPAGTELDDRCGCHFISVVGFRFRDTRVLGVAVPCHRDFDEVNLRFYVRREVANEVRRGVVFVREVVPRRAVAAVANGLFHENYVCRPMGSDVRRPDTQSPGRAEYRWRGSPNWLAVGAEFDGEPTALQTGSAAAFIAEHYWGYVRRRDGVTAEYRVEHPPWRVWPARRAWLTGDAGRFYGPTFAEALARRPASAFVAEGSAVTVYRGEQLPPC